MQNMKNATTLEQCVSRSFSSSSAKGSVQRHPSGIPVGIGRTVSNTATGLNAQPQKLIRKGTQHKRRIQFLHGKASAIVVDPRKILRLAILVVASACCYIICHSLVKTLNDESVKQIRGGSTERDEQKQNAFSTTRPTNYKGKEPILQILQEAGITDLDQNTIDRLPTWEEVTSVYGSKPIIYGLETCASFRESSDPADHFLAVAGTFNSGTNLLSELLIHNCHLPARMAKYGPINEGIRWQVPWGKHTPIDDEEVRQTHKVSSGDKIPSNNVFPAVTIRDPAVWAVSMCRNEYAMEWTHINSNEIGGESEQHCPNFVPNDIDILQNESLRNASSIPVTIHYARFNKTHDSMIDHWNNFYYEYYKQERFPRVIVRFEDLIFHPKSVVQTVCECAGGELKHENESGFQYIVDSAKITEGHGSAKTGYVDAIIKYGSAKFPRWRSGGMTDEDRVYGTEQLDREMMNVFGYQYPDSEGEISVA